MTTLPLVQNARTLTVIVHGTYAHNETWWHPGQDFARALEERLAASHLPGTVWAPDLVPPDKAPEWCAWSGRNRDLDRREGGRRLAEGLARAAARAQASREVPLIVNIVAHSHGGNVALEALRHLPEEVRVGRVVLLGTPLFCCEPAHRGPRILIAALAMLAALSLFLSILLLLFLSPLIFLDYEFRAWLSSMPNRWMALGGTVGAGIALPWALKRLESRWMEARRRDGLTREHLVYGPPLEQLRGVIGAKSIVLVSSMDDEAALLLEVCGAPERLYHEFVKDLQGAHKLLQRLFDPLMRHLALPLVELFLERYMMGMPWRQMLLRNDYRLAQSSDETARGLFSVVEEVGRNRSGNRRIPIERIYDFDRRAGTDRRSGIERRILELPADGEFLRRLQVETPRLWARLSSLQQYFWSQVQLRHSLYYRNGAVIRLVASYVEEGTRAALRAEGPLEQIHSPLASR